MTPIPSNPVATVLGINLEAAACEPLPYEGISVEIRRLELRASSMPWKRATNCAISPRTTPYRVRIF